MIVDGVAREKEEVLNELIYYLMSMSMSMSMMSRIYQAEFSAIPDISSYIHFHLT